MRDERFDFYKGFLIWGVIWGHTITAMLNGQNNDICIHSFFRTYDMPFFMAISGYFLSFSIKRYNSYTLIKNKFTTIAIPGIIWATLLSLGHDNPFGSFYFIWAIFWSSIMMIVINRVINNKTFQILIYIIIILLLHFIEVQPYRIYNLPYLFPFFILGFYAWHLIEFGRKHFLIVLPVFVTLLCFWRTDYTIWNIGANFFGGFNLMIQAITLRFFIAITGIIVMSVCFDIIFRFLTEYNPQIKTFIVLFGRETLGLYILQGFVVFRLLGYIVKYIERLFGYNVFASNHMLLGYVVTPLTSMIIIIVLFYFITIIKKYKYFRPLFGFKI